jgi:hypothetical protein
MEPPAKRTAHIYCTSVDFQPMNGSNPRSWDLLGAMTGDPQGVAFTLTGGK